MAGMLFNNSWCDQNMLKFANIYIFLHDDVCFLYTY